MQKKLLHYFHSHSPEMQGIFWMLLHCMCGALFSMFGRMFAADYHIFQVVLLYGIASFICILLWVNKDIAKTYATNKLKIHFIRAVFGFAGVTFWLFSIKYNPLVEATAVSFLTPTIASVLAVIILKEKITKHRIIALIAGFIGILVILRPGIEIFRIASILPLITALTWSCTDLTIKAMAKTESIKTQTLYVGTFGMLFSIPLGLSVWVTPVPGDIILAVGMGISALGLITTICKALANGDISFIIPFIYTSLIFNSIVAWFMFGEKLDIFTFIGAVIIAAASLNVIIREKQPAKRLESDAIDAKI